LEDGWKKRQEWQKNGTHHRPLSMLWNIIQICPKQKKNIGIAKTKHPSTFFYFHKADILGLSEIFGRRVKTKVVRVPFEMTHTFQMKVDSIQPSQLYISSEKLDSIMKKR
jgi:hypothetical protein